MALEAWQYGNPETILERKQEHQARQLRACGECIHHKQMEFQGDNWHFCEFKRMTFGKRCHLYTVKKGT
jgi:hypothetical protein